MENLLNSRKAYERQCSLNDKAVKVSARFAKQYSLYDIADALTLLAKADYKVKQAYNLKDNSDEITGFKYVSERSLLNAMDLLRSNGYRSAVTTESIKDSDEYAEVTEAVGSLSFMEVIASLGADYYALHETAINTYLTERDRQARALNKPRKNGSAVIVKMEEATAE